MRLDLPMTPQQSRHILQLMARVSCIAIVLAVAAGAASLACGTLGPIASPTPIVIESSPTPTPTLADRAKSDISARFAAQQSALNAGDLTAAYEMCAPDYRAQSDVSQFTKAINDYLERFNVTPRTLDTRNLRVSKGTAERYDISYDIYIDGEFSESVNNAGGYLVHDGAWFDDHALCR